MPQPDTPEVLTARLRARIDEHSGGSVSNRWPSIVHETYLQLVAALTDNDVAQEDAEYAASQVMIERAKTVDQCVAEQQTEEARRTRKTRFKERSR